MSKLTGKTRHRVHKTFLRQPLLVLQYQISYPYNDCGSEVTGFKWIDAHEAYEDIDFEGFEL